MSKRPSIGMRTGWVHEFRLFCSLHVSKQAEPVDSLSVKTKPRCSCRRNDDDRDALEVFVSATPYHWFREQKLAGAGDRLVDR
jgi:hypothetical protein